MTQYLSPVQGRWGAGRKGGRSESGYWIWQRDGTLNFRKDEAQNRMAEMLDQWAGDLEKCWWGDGTGKPFPPSLITLAEKLGFNVEKIFKNGQYGGFNGPVITFAINTVFFIIKYRTYLIDFQDRFP